MAIEQQVPERWSRCGAAGCHAVLIPSPSRHVRGAAFAAFGVFAHDRGWRPHTRAVFHVILAKDPLGRAFSLCYEAPMLTDRDSLLRKLHELRSEHRDLDTVIARLAEQGAADQLHLQRLKKRKLMLKDEISWLESRLIPDSIA